MLKYDGPSGYSVKLNQNEKYLYLEVCVHNNSKFRLSTHG